MASQQQDAPPSAGTYASFALAQEEEQPSTGATETPSPAEPRALFGRSSGPVLPSYLTHFVNPSTLGLRMEHVEEECDDNGVEDDSSVEDLAESNELTEALVENFEDRQHDDDVPFTEANGIRNLTPTSNIPRPPDDWTPPPVKTAKGEPAFEDVDNPGDWHRFCYQPAFKTNGRFSHYQLPTKAQPVPLKDGLRS